jgi:NitT/TauT family transport system substrate-binding protein
MRAIRRLAICLASVAMLTACSNSTSSSSESMSIRISNPANISNVPLYLGISKGFFKAEGLSVTADVDLGAGSTVEAVIGGQVDMAWSNISGVVQPYSQGIGLRLVAVSDRAAPHSLEVLVKNSSPARTLRDLVGKKVAILAPTTTCAWVMGEELIREGLKPNAINTTVVAPADHPTVLDAGQVDASCTTDPSKTAMQQQLGARSVFDAGAGGQLVGGYVVSSAYASQHPKTIAAFQRAFAKSAQYANDHPDEVSAQLTSYAHVDRSIADKVAVNKYVSDVGVASVRGDVQNVADAMRRTGLLSSDVDVTGFLYSQAAG